MTSGPAFLGELRDGLLNQVLGLLKADPVVEGVALIGSLGRGTSDNWSDIDLLIIMGDRALARFADAPAASPWAQADLLSDGRHNSPAATAKTADEIRRIHLSYVPIAGKYIARRSPRACQMIRFLGSMPDFSACDPAAQLLALRGIAGELADPSWTWLNDAVASYLNLIEANL